VRRKLVRVGVPQHGKMILMPEQVSKKFYNWASILESQAREQAQRTASMPFIYPHLALMPDAHLGKGSTVGSVIPTLGAIIPAAVGVDIGCFHGDTRVPLLNGRQRSLKDLADGKGPYWVYSLGADGRIVPGRAVALKTRSDAELMRVTVSGGDEIVCTPDHPFMMNDGTYREARDLRFNDSLMLLYRRWQTRDGYESVSTGKGGSRQTHVLVYEAVNGPVPPGTEVHHKDHVHFNNEPGNHNHKVIAVEHLAERADAYCLQVEEHHNFALAAGVFVHNCGMHAVRTQFTAGDMHRGDLAALREAIEAAVPLSAGKYNKTVYAGKTEARIAELEAMDGAGNAESIAPNWRLQLGSLGSGNHFIEVSLDELDRVWLFLHSGSRGVGNKLAVKHIRVAQRWCERSWIQLPDPDLAYLTEGTDDFWAYIRDLRWAQHFALLNRQEMMHRVLDCLGKWAGEPAQGLEAVQCFAGETEVMTRAGSRPIESLAGSDHELLTANGAWTKAPVRSFGRQEVS
jgi:tRNA-splicing ligase RtcB